MSDYQNLIAKINTFLVSTNKLQPLSEELFQGVFIKKLSNSNLISSKKYINVSTGKRTHQSHLDLTGQDTLSFFFGDNPPEDLVYTQIMIDIPVDHLKLLQEIDISEEVIEKRGRLHEDAIVLKRKIPQDFSFKHTSDLYHYAYAFKKLEGHQGNQNQINRLQNKDEFFALCACAYENDLLILLKHTLEHYICLLLPSEFATDIKSIIGTSVNYSISNPLYSKNNASSAFCKIMESNVEKEFSDISDTLQHSNSLNGQEKEQLTKARVGQGSFRKLLIEQRGCTCELCSVRLPEVLRASHIQSWANSSPAERMDLQNGLLLCANHDVLFDRHLITIDSETNELKISSVIPTDQLVELKLDNTKQIVLSDRMKAYMKKHNQLFEE